MSVVIVQTGSRFDCTQPADMAVDAEVGHDPIMTSVGDAPQALYARSLGACPLQMAQ